MIADLHIHSKYSRATSRDCDAPNLDKWARNKGIDIVGTGDFTHPAWRAELQGQFVPAEDGLYTLRDEHRLPADVFGSLHKPRFVVSGEISTIYKKNGKTRKVHHVILLPSLEDAEILAHRLEAIGNLHSDGRPILGLDSRDLLEITLNACPEAIYIPAHIWTPHFSLFGAFSGFDTIEECYEDLTPYVHALETGLSSDPAMNRRVSALDGLTLVSNSDAHSPPKLGREANVLDIGFSYAQLKRAIEIGEGFEKTLEFFPEEGKYHLDGHRQCKLRLEPSETLALGSKCPVCGKKLTIGVLHRVEELADRVTPPSPAKAFGHIIPLPELIAACTGASAASKKTQERYFGMLRVLGSEFDILSDIAIDDLEKAAGYAIAEGVRRMRSGRVKRLSGYDGEYGVISLFEPQELEMLRGQVSLFGMSASAANKSKALESKLSFSPKAIAEESSAQEVGAFLSPLEELNTEQLRAVTAAEADVAVIAGPGTGKTKTLVARIAYLIEERGVKPSEITAVTFTNQAASEMRQRLQVRLGGKQQVRGLTVGTFHAICLGLLDQKPLLGEHQALAFLSELLSKQGSDDSPLASLRKISAAKNGQTCKQLSLDPGLYESYGTRLKGLGVRDLDDLLLDALKLDVHQKHMFQHLLVDEFQDINAVQHQLIRHWREKGQSLFVIGDPDQSIYGFRGADARCFYQLQKEVPSLHVVTLRQNYRSAPAIVASALSVISHNPGDPRVLQANRPAMEPVRLMKAQKPFDESVWIAKEISRMVGGVDMLSAASAEGARHASRSFSDMAVLCRTRHQLDQVESCLRHDSLPCIRYGREANLSEKSVLGALGFFRSLVQPSDAASLLACLRTVWRIPQALAQRAQHCMASMSEIDAASLHAALDEFEALTPWLAAVDNFLPRLKKGKPRVLLQAWAEAYGQNAAMQHLLNASVFHGDMCSFLQTLALGEEADIRRMTGKTYPTDAVRLLTLHGSKGLEFPVVFLSCDEMLKPGREYSADEIEEERRLFFVGMTRAKEELVLTSADESLSFLKELDSAVREENVAQRNRWPKAEQLSLF